MRRQGKVAEDRDSSRRLVGVICLEWLISSLMRVYLLLRSRLSLRLSSV